MKDILQDVVAHTHQLGFLSLVKVTNEEKTKIEILEQKIDSWNYVPTGIRIEIKL